MSQAARKRPASARRERTVRAILIVAMVGLVALAGTLGWYAWRESVGAEEQRLGRLARALGQHADSVLVDARSLLEQLNASDVPRCSAAHIARLQEEAIARPHIRAIGYWQAIQRRCGVGFIQGSPLTPPEASRIYPSGVVAWWPGPDTAVGDVELFIMRLGEHDLAIDPRLLLDQQLTGDQRAGLWVEGLLMASSPPQTELPDPDTVAPGLTIDNERRIVVSRFSLETLFPMEVVAIQPSAHFFSRYGKTLLTAGVLAVVLMSLWGLFVRQLSRRHLSLAGELRSAIEHNGIQVVYQPIVDLTTGRCCGAEVLARWQRSDGEAISPDVFIALAEEHDIVGEITRCVLQKAIRQMGDVLRDHPELSININLSPKDLENDTVATLLDTELKRARLPAAALKLEITERGLLDSDGCRQLIASLRERGHRIAIDDFGTGYSSLSYLESFEIDTLKLDKAFVDAVETHAVTSSVISHIIQMAQSLELDMVAEGIESKHQADWLREAGVTQGQGYLFSRPLRARQFIEYLATD